MAEDKVKIETSDDTTIEVEDTAPIKEPVEEKKPKKAKKAKKPKPAAKKVKPAEKRLSKGDVWWKAEGQEFVRKGHSQRGIILKAARATGTGFDKAMAAMRAAGSVEDKVKSLFDS
jgi:outer membrane biosynthesis protein TonB